MEKQSRQAKVQECMKELEKGIQEWIRSGKIQEYLDFMAAFHRYSFNNSLLIFMQKPGATLVKGFKQWKQHGRWVKKGEKGIRILAPIQLTITKKKRDDKGNIIRDDQGKPVMEKVKVQAFKTVSVFDVSQTEGEELPKVTGEIRGTSEEGERLYEELKGLIPIPVHEGDTGSAHGYYDLIHNEIVISKKNDRHHQLKTLIHEYAHYLLHRKGAKYEKESREIQEAQAESIAYVVARHFGIDTRNYSFAYVAAWSQETEIIQQIGAEVQQLSHRIIEEMETARRVGPASR